MSTFSRAPAAQKPFGYRVRDLVALTGLSESTIRRLIADGTLSTIHVGRSVFVTPDSVDDLFQAGR